ncbi:trypsin-like peptidase domain-containing protein [Candidatus Poriferisodalis sp.]|uniref:trypsin-like peptidase domain-containing protein n=1 Tax=Candidatus Poriferisodalis sp. TaxID=3101277 RepID=UPI003B5A91D8
MTWQELIDVTADDAELACIDDALGDELREELLGLTASDGEGWPVITSKLLGISVGDDRWPHELWRCMAPETAAAVYVSVTLEELREVVAIASGYEECVERLPGDAELAASISERLSSEYSIPDNEDLSDFLGELDEDVVLPRLAPCIGESDESSDSAGTDRTEVTASSARDGDCSQQQGPELGAEEIYDRIAPSIAYIETDWGSGSGILVEGDYVLTNHHVLWPFEAATVVFPDGSEYVDVPLVATNPWADIALIGPLDTDGRQLALVDGEQLPPGSDVYLIGYPAEYEYSPQPTITRGILSRVRHWDSYDHTLLQTDSAIAGGQSGGALVDGRGCVVGVSTWSWTDANFAVSTSAADNADLIDLMLNDDGYVFSYSDRIGDPEQFAHEQHIVVTDEWESFTFVASSPAGDDIELELQGANGAGLWVADIVSNLIDVDEALPRRATVPGPYAFVQVAGTDAGASYTLRSNAVLSRYHDEDGTSLGIDVGNAGIFDYNGDVDWYTIQLSRGDTIRIWTDSIGADTTLTLFDQDSAIVAEDDDSGPVAVFGDPVNAEILYEAIGAGAFHIAVSYYPEFSYSQNYIINVESIE